MVRGMGQDADFPVAPTARETDRRMRQRGRLHTLLAGAGALGLFLGVHLTHRPGVRETPLSEQTLDGAWELTAVNGDPVGPKADSTVLSQRITFRQGRAFGETVLRARSEVATTALPFPDQSVRRVIASPDGHDVTVKWDGAYTLLENRRLELHFGAATYRAAVTLAPNARSLRFDHDAILTFPGPTDYRALSAAQLAARK